MVPAPSVQKKLPVSDTDPATRLLLHVLAEADGTCLWLADEHHGAILSELAAANRSHPITLVTNRFDVSRDAQARGLDAHFTDWQLPQQCWQNIFLKVCKERPVNHHLIQQAFTHLHPGGQLWLAGEKSTGIKTYAKNASQVFSQNTALQKTGNAYHSCLRKTDLHPGSQLDSQDYPTLRTIGALHGQPLLSKPGVYGWQKVDAGSALLIEQWQEWQRRVKQPPESLLDLGCGYGYLTLASGDFPWTTRVATDNNAAALHCMAANAKAHSLEVRVVPGDCGDTLTEQFDVILCNPPFHTGFATDADLLARFLAAARQRLHPQGHALFVVNSFRPLEKIAGKWFDHCQLLRDNRQFKVFELRPSKPYLGASKL